MIPSKILILEKETVEGIISQKQMYNMKYVHRVATE